MKLGIKLAAILILAGCAPKATPPAASPEPTASIPGATEPSARFIFHKDNFTELTDYLTTKHTIYQCLGDGTKTFYTNGEDYTGTPTEFPALSDPDDFSPTSKPSFIKNVSVDLTNTYFTQAVLNTVQTDACSYRGITGSTNPSPCADFDELNTVVPTPTIAPTPTVSPTPTPASTPSTDTYYGTKFYRVRDDWCIGQGPILTGNEDTTKAYIGGVSIDLDRTALGAAEDLLMMVTYQSLNSNASWPGPQATPAPPIYPLGNDETILEVNLIGTKLGLDILLGTKQPRVWSSYDNPQMPIYMKNVATLRDPYGSLRTEQVYIPLSNNPLIDRIRLDRVRGSYHLFQIDLYRLGNRSN